MFSVYRKQYQQVNLNCQRLTKRPHLIHVKYSYATSAVLSIKCDTGITEMWRYRGSIQINSEEQPSHRHKIQPSDLP